MSDRLTLLEGKIGEMSTFMDLLADEVRVVEVQNAITRRERLEGRLGVAIGVGPTGGGGGRGGSAGVPLGVDISGRDIANTIGNVVPVPGQANLLNEPGFDGVSLSDITLTTSLQTVSYGASTEIAIGFPSVTWRALKTAGTAATCTLVQGAEREDQTDSPFTTARVDLRIRPTGSGTHEIRLDAGQRSVANLPEGGNYLVGSIRVCSFFAQTLTGITSRSLVVELYDVADAVVRATTTVDLPDTVSDSIVEASRIWAALNLTTITAAERDHFYQLRIRLIVVSTAGTGDVTYSIGEPQLHLAYSPDPVQFAPAIAGWAPMGFQRVNAVTGAELIGSGKRFADTVLRYVLTADGTQEWGPGNAARNTRLGWLASGQMFFDANGQANVAQFNIVATSGQRANLAVRVDGDTSSRAVLFGDATLSGLELGPGNAARDVNLYRAAANVLKTDDKFLAAGGLDGMTVHAPVEATASSTDYSTTSGSYVDIGTPFDQNVVAPPSGRVLLLAVLDLHDPNPGSIADVTIGYNIDAGADVDLGGHAFDANNPGRLSVTCFDVITGLTPGTTYDISLRWKVSSGTGQITAASRGAARQGSKMLLLPLA